MAIERKLGYVDREVAEYLNMTPAQVRNMRTLERMIRPDMPTLCLWAERAAVPAHTVIGADPAQFFLWTKLEMRRRNWGVTKEELRRAEVTKEIYLLECALSFGNVADTERTQLCGELAEFQNELAVIDGDVEVTE